MDTTTISPHAQDVITLLKTVGLSKLMVMDGCVCSACSVKNVDIKISCRQRRIRVWSPSLDYSGDDASLLAIGEEVNRQIKPLWFPDRGDFDIALLDKES